MITVICNECGMVWPAPAIIGPVVCPQCESKDVSVAVKQSRKKRLATAGGRWR